MIDRTIRVMKDCYEWNLEDGFLPDAAACLINIGGIFSMTGDPEGARASLQEAILLLKDQPQHPLVARAKASLVLTSSTSEPGADCAQSRQPKDTSLH